MLGTYDNGQTYDIEQDSMEDIVDYMVSENKNHDFNDVDYLTNLIDDLMFLRGLYINNPNEE